MHVLWTRKMLVGHGEFVMWSFHHKGCQRIPHYKCIFFSCLQQEGFLDKYPTRAVKSTNNENRREGSGSAQGLVRQTNPSLSNEHELPPKSYVKIQPILFTRFAMVKCKSSSKDHFFRPSWSLAVHSLFVHICSCLMGFQQRQAYLLSQENIHGQIHLQHRTTGMQGLTRGLIPSKASFQQSRMVIDTSQK